MKKTKRPSPTKAGAVTSPRHFVWWPWAVGVLALLLVFQIYAPALDGGFVLDDRSLPFFAPDITPDIGRFVNDLRPLLMLSFWIDFRRANDDSGSQSNVKQFAEPFHVHQRHSSHADVGVGRADRREAARMGRRQQPSARGHRHPVRRDFSAASAADRIGGLRCQPVGAAQRAVLLRGLRGISLPAARNRSRYGDR